MKNMSKPTTAILIAAVMVWSMAFSCASAIASLQTYVPIGIAAFDGAIDIISPVPGSPLQIDKILVDHTWGTITAAITAYNAAPAADKKTKLGELITAMNATESGISKTLQDFGVSGNTDEAIKAALILLNATLSAIEARLAPPTAASSKARASVYVKAVSVKGQTIPISGRPQDFVKSYNQIMVTGGHADHQLKGK